MCGQTMRLPNPREARQMTTKAPTHTADSSAHAPRRSCVICRQTLPKAELTRYVVSPAQLATTGCALLEDPRKRLPGRGWYCCAEEACRRKISAYQGWRRRAKAGGGQTGVHHG